MMILAFAGLSVAVNAQDAPATPDPNAPDIKWEDMTIDYGTVKKGDEGAATRAFKFTNVGKTPLILSSCRGSCGCTVPTCPTEPILPGKSATISVHYDINHIGPFTKTVSVSSNAKTPNETLKITGTVVDEPVGTVAPAPAPAQPTKAAPAPATAPAKGKTTTKAAAKGQSGK